MLNYDVDKLRSLSSGLKTQPYAFFPRTSAFHIFIPQNVCKFGLPLHCGSSTGP